MPNYPKEQLRQLYKDLPEDLQKAVFSEDVAQNIREICEQNNIKDDNIVFDISKNIGYVFLGLLPPNELAEAFKKELKIEEKTAEKTAAQINRFIFLPLKNSLEAMYKIEIKAGKSFDAPKSPAQKKEIQEKKQQTKAKDRYREPTE